MIKRILLILSILTVCARADIGLLTTSGSGQTVTGTITTGSNGAIYATHLGGIAAASYSTTSQMAASGTAYSAWALRAQPGTVIVGIGSSFTYGAGLPLDSGTTGGATLRQNGGVPGTYLDDIEKSPWANGNVTFYDFGVSGYTSSQDLLIMSSGTTPGQIASLPTIHSLSPNATGSTAPHIFVVDSGCAFNDSVPGKPVVTAASVISNLLMLSGSAKADGWTVVMLVIPMTTYPIAPGFRYSVYSTAVNAILSGSIPSDLVINLTGNPANPDPNFYTWDGLHPNLQGHKVIAGSVLSSLSQALALSSTGGFSRYESNRPVIVSGSGTELHLFPGGSSLVMGDLITSGTVTTGGYSCVTLNGTSNDGSLLGMTGGKSTDPNLYIEAPGAISLRAGGGTKLFGSFSVSGSGRVIVTGSGVSTLPDTGQPFQTKVPLTYTPFTVSTLPSASTAGAGSVASVSDAVVNMVGTTYAGGGNNKSLLMSDGTNWITLSGSATGSASLQPSSAFLGVSSGTVTCSGTNGAWDIGTSGTTSTCLFVGDSRTFGVSLSSSATQRFSYLFSQLPFANGHYNVVNQGIPASRVLPGNASGGSAFGVNNNIADRYATVTKPYRPNANGGNGGTKSYLFVLAGRNEWADGTTPEAVSNSLMLYTSTAHQDGFTVVMSTELPEVGGNTNRMILNKYILSGSTGADYIVDAGSALPDPSQAVFYTDGLHPNAAGHAILAALYNQVMIGDQSIPQVPALWPAWWQNCWAVSGTAKMFSTDNRSNLWSMDPSGLQTIYAPSGGAPQLRLFDNGVDKVNLIEAGGTTYFDYTGTWYWRANSGTGPSATVDSSGNFTIAPNATLGGMTIASGTNNPNLYFKENGTATLRIFTNAGTTYEDYSGTKNFRANYGSGPNSTLDNNGQFTSGGSLIAGGGYLKSKAYTSGTIPSASAAGAGAIVYVTDATSPTYGGTYSGGGSAKALLMSDGSNWIVH